MDNGQLIIKRHPDNCQLSTINCQLSEFISDWKSPSPYLEVQTSGSTGVPKRITVRKEQMANSARLTCDYLGLRQRDKALLCMPLRYIAGKMMVVRSLVAGLDLIVREPSGHPMADIDMPLRFAAMIPLQVYNTLQVPEERERLCQTEILIIGGGSIDRELEAQIQELPICVYSTYGMTETLSHIALRRLNGPEASSYYTPFPSVKLSLSADSTLVIDAPLVADETLVTNDVAELLPDGRFRILGRKDNIINSGGIKIQAETVEEALRPVISANFAITSVPDPKFGEAMVLLITAGNDHFPGQGTTFSLTGKQSISLPENSLLSEWEEKIFEILPKYQRPKHILPIEAIPLTGSGKIDRAACRKLAKQLTMDN
jgi:O-succinylbenzoic acid--CoA ligase